MGYKLAVVVDFRNQFVVGSTESLLFLMGWRFLAAFSASESDSISYPQPEATSVSLPVCFVDAAIA